MYLTYITYYYYDSKPIYYFTTIWPEILAGNLFWRIGGFESNPPIFLPPKLCNHIVFLLNKPDCARPID